jgi:hypothetical protein
MRRNIFLMLLLLAGCKKYEQVPATGQAAYFRLFNGLTNLSHSSNDLVTPLQDRPVSARLSVFIDPATDSNGILNTAAIADNLYPKGFFYTPHPDVAGTRVYFDPDYPGSKVVETSPVTNGLDLSRWATIASGKHRIVFTALPIGITTASQVNSIRFNTLVDTTVDMRPGHYYSLEPLNDSARFRLYFRDEGFENSHFDTSKINVRFINMCRGRDILPDTFDVYYRYHYYTDQIYLDRFTGQFGGYLEADDTTNTFLTTVNKRWASTPGDAPYVSLPPAPAAKSFWLADGTIKPANLRPALVITLCKPTHKPPNSNIITDPPLLQFVCTENFVTMVGTPQTSSPGMDSLPAYYFTPPGFGYAFYNPQQFSTVPIAGELWQYVFISGLPPRRQPLISTIEFMDNYWVQNGQPNSYNIDKSNLRIYVTTVEPQYGNPY